MAYNGRRGPNVSEYIANLNAIPSAQDLQSAQDNFNLDDELAMFTNTQFFDFDLGQDADLQAANFGVEGPGSAAAPEATDMKAMDFGMQGKRSMEFPCHRLYFAILSSLPRCQAQGVMASIQFAMDRCINTHFILSDASLLILHLPLLLPSTICSHWQFTCTTQCILLHIFAALLHFSSFSRFCSVWLNHP